MSYKANQEKLEINSSGVLNASNVPSTEPPDGSITTAKLANDAVTAVKLANGAVTAVKRSQHGNILASAAIPNGQKMSNDVNLVGSIVCASDGSAVEVGFEEGRIQTTAHSNADIYYEVFRGANKIGSISFAGNIAASGVKTSFPSNVVKFIDLTPPVGSNTYSFYVNNPTDIPGQSVEFIGVLMRVRMV